MVCSNCGSEIFITDKFCKVCGNSLNDQTSSIQAVNQPSDAIPVKKKRKWIWVAVIALVVLVLYFGSSDREIDSVKESTLMAYDYGKTIGTSLHNWFGGSEEWYVIEEDGETYVCVRGECKYLTDVFEPTQMFAFRLSDDGDYFYFEGAYDANEDPIFSNTGNIVDSWALELYDSYLGVNFHDYALQAAFGNDEVLSAFEDI